jgi:hypothetical protein
MAMFNSFLYVYQAGYVSENNEPLEIWQWNIHHCGFLIAMSPWQ